MHCSQLVVELRKHDAAWSVRLAQQVANDRDWSAWEGELPAHQHHQREAEQQEQHCCNGVLNADDFVVLRKNVSLQKAKFVLVVSVFSVRDVLRGRHVLQRRDSFLDLPGDSEVARKPTHRAC